MERKIQGVCWSIRWTNQCRMDAQKISESIQTEEKMSKNLITKFRKFWRTLSFMEQKRLWSIMTALRGEDGGNDDVKHRTTARIRGLLFGIKLKKGTSGFFKPNPIVDTTMTQRERFQGTSDHFKHHIREALYSLKPYVKKEKFKDLLRFL